jgi:ATP-binding cassette subfamily F protein 2
MGQKAKPKAAKAKAAKLAKELAENAKKDAIKSKASDRPAILDQAVVTGVLASQGNSMDVKIEQFSINIHGKEFVKDTKLDLTYGRRYGLIGSNGSGKSTILAAIAHREIPIPEHIDIWHLHGEAPPSDMTAVDSVVDYVKKEHARLEELTLKLLEEDAEANAELIDRIGEKLEKMDPSTFEVRACELLDGLGFSLAMMKKSTKDMSGGWRMRVSLSQALFVEPTLLLLDEPTNHLDLGACVWLEEYLKNYPSMLIVISHSQDFLNGVCTNTMQLTQKGELVTWGGNYDQYCKTREEFEKNQMTKYKKEQEDIAHLQEFIRSCGTYSNLRKQADSKQKIIDKMKEAGLTEKPIPDPTFNFQFPEADMIPPPVLAFDKVGFAYSGKKEDMLYKQVSFGVDLDSRIALVGPNGAGKSTLLKLMLTELTPTEGEVKRHGQLRIGRYNQHSEEVLDMEAAPLDFVIKKYEQGIHTRTGLRKLEFSEWRQNLGKYGIVQEYQTRPMKTMSDGMRTRVVMMLIALSNPHILLLDEPTNHLDMECIDALADAINKFNGGLVLVSHDFRLIGQVAKEIWLCDKKTIEPWNGDIQSYKKKLQKDAARKIAKDK